MKTSNSVLITSLRFIIGIKRGKIEEKRTRHDQLTVINVATAALFSLFIANCSLLIPHSYPLFCCNQSLFQHILAEITLMTLPVTGRSFFKPVVRKPAVFNDLRREDGAESRFAEIKKITVIRTGTISLQNHAGKGVHPGSQFHHIYQPFIMVNILRPYP